VLILNGKSLELFCAEAAKSFREKKKTARLQSGGLYYLERSHKANLLTGWVQARFMASSTSPAKL